MAKVKLLADEPLLVSILPHGTLRRVEPGEVFDVDDKHVESYECQPDLYDVQPVKKPTRKAS